MTSRSLTIPEAFMQTRDTIDEDFAIVDAVGIFYLIHLFTNQSQRTEEKERDDAVF